MKQEKIFVIITPNGLPELKAKAELLVTKAEEIQELINEINEMEVDIKAEIEKGEKKLEVQDED